MSRSAGMPRARGRTTALAALIALVSAALLTLSSGTALAAPVHRLWPLAHHGSGHHPHGKTAPASAHHANASAALVAFKADPLSPDTAGNGAGLLGNVIGGLVSAVGTLDAAVPGILDSTTNVLRTTTGVLSGQHSSTPPTPPAGPTQAPTSIQLPVSAMPLPTPVAASTPAAVLPRTSPAAQQVQAAPAVAPSTALQPEPKPRSSSHHEGIFENPAAILTSPGTAILVGLILVFLGLVTAMVLGAGYRGRRGH